MFTKQFVLTAALAAVALSSVSHAAPITVDGNLNDWGISVADSLESNYRLKNDIGLLNFQREDQSDSGGDASDLGPGLGGQNYDVEFMGIALQGTTLYLAIVSGQRPDNGFARYAPGDIFIATVNGFFGIEVGGGLGGGAGSAITQGAAGSTYTVDSDGYTVYHNNATAAQVAGSVWSNVDLILAPGTSAFTQFTTNGGSIHAGDADYVYTRDSVTGQHSIIELSLDTSLFGDNRIWAIFWAPAGYNDEVLVRSQIITQAGNRASIQQVPEPETMALFGLGITALGMMRRRRHPA